MTAAAPVVEQFLDLALAGDRPGAARLVVNQVDSGVATSAVIGELLGPAQHEVGERWHRAEWSAADEHPITGVSQAALEALATMAPATNPALAALVVACAEGDWHSLDQAALVLEADASRLADRAFTVLEQQLPVMATYDARQRLRTREDLVYIVRYVAASLLVDDPDVFTSFQAWLQDLLTARGVPKGALQAGLRALAPMLDEIDTRTQVLVARA